MEFRFTMTPEDTRLYYEDYASYKKKAVNQQTWRISCRSLLYYTELIGVPIGLFCVVDLWSGSADKAIISTILSAIGWRPLLDWLWKRSSLNKINNGPQVLEHHCVRILSEGFCDRTSFWEWTIFWPGIQNIVLMENNILLLTEKNSAFPIPCRIFATPEEIQAAFENMTRVWKSFVWPPPFDMSTLRVTDEIGEV